MPAPKGLSKEKYKRALTMKSGSFIPRIRSRKYKSTIESLLDENTVYHGTRHKIEGSKFDLSKIGTGEGNQAYGWGIYVAESPAVSSAYQLTGAEEKEKAPYLFTFNDGTEVTSVEVEDFIRGKVKDWDKWPRIYAQNFGERVQYFSDTTNVQDELNKFVSNLKPESTEAQRWKELTSDLREYRSNGRNTYFLGDFESEEALKAEIDKLAESFRPFQKEMAQKLQAVCPVKIEKRNPRGHIYLVDGPERDQCLDLDLKVGEQPTVVRKAIENFNVQHDSLLEKNWQITLDMAKNIRQEQEFHIVDNLKAFKEKYEGDGEFYNGLRSRDIKLRDLFPDLEVFFSMYLSRRDFPFVDQLKATLKSGAAIDEQFTGKEAYEEISRLLGGDKQASMYFKSQGVPGLCYLDEFSRKGDGKSKNFVVWDMDLLTIVRELSEGEV